MFYIAKSTINALNRLKIKQVYLINILGQTVKSWNSTNTPNLKNVIKLPVRNIDEATDAVKVITEDGIIAIKRVIVKQLL